MPRDRQVVPPNIGNSPPQVDLHPPLSTDSKRRGGSFPASPVVMAVETGEGDSVAKYAKLWEGMTLEEIHQEVLKARERGEI
jgi:hypothetical protein